MREKICFDRDWMFHKGDLDTVFPTNGKDAAYLSAKTERMLWGPASQKYDTGALNPEKWKKVDLPHDYVIEELPSEEYSCAFGFVPHHNAWYIKKFRLEECDKNRRITLLFEGVATHATVYLNGCLLKHNFCGYNSFEVDLSDVVKYNTENTLSVYVNTQHHEGWWYEGGGIYRHVWLCKTDLLAVDLWGVFAKPVKKANKDWSVETEVTLRNDDIKAHRVTLQGEILDADGNTVATAQINGGVEQKDKRVFQYRFSITNPSLWSPDTPVQYTMRTHVLCGKNECDTYDVKFGFREIYADPQKGLFINGKHYKIQGLCGHADCGLLGKAVPDNIHRYKVQLMKEMGANGYRTTHYPQAEALMDALDEAGFIVMDETRWFESTEEGKAHLEMLMKRDRNRPGVIFWSIGNEEPHHTTEEGRRIAQSLFAMARRLDDSRLIMTAVSHDPDRATVYDELDVVGVNYNWNIYEEVHRRFPNKPLVSSECCATGTTRGWYFPDSPEKAYIAAHDHDTNDYFKSREYTWKFIDAREWMMGGYQWIAFEHRGEAAWPRLCSQSGAIDLFLQKKDAYHQNRSHWTTEPMVHLLPHWNFEGMDGEPIHVVAYTNQARLELFLNGVSQGIQEIERHGHGEWEVPYTPGRIEAVAYDHNGNIVARDCRITAGKAHRLALELGTRDICANGRDIAVVNCYVVDADGNPVENATPTVSFSANALGSIYSTGSDICDHTSLFASTRHMRAGRIGVAVKLKETAGTLKIYAHADGLESAVLTVEIE